MIEYTRTIGISESRRRYIHVEKVVREKMFPAPAVKFKGLVDGESFNLELDKVGRIWSSQLGIKFKFTTGDIFCIKKLSNRLYSIEQINKPNFPNLS